MCPKFGHPAQTCQDTFTCQDNVFFFAEEKEFCNNCEWFVSSEVVLAFKIDLIFLFLALPTASTNSMLMLNPRNALGNMSESRGRCQLNGKSFCVFSGVKGLTCYRLSGLFRVKLTAAILALILEITS